MGERPEPDDALEPVEVEGRDGLRAAPRTRALPHHGLETTGRAPDPRGWSAGRCDASARSAVVAQGGVRGVRTARTVDAAARVRAGRGEVQPADRCAHAAVEARGGSEEELLAQRGGPAVHRPADEVGVEAVERRWGEHVPRAHERAEARRAPLDSRLDPIGQAVTVPVVPATRDPVAARVPADLLGEVRIGPRGFGAGGRAGRVGGRRLADDEIRIGGHLPVLELVAVGAQRVDRVDEVHDPGTAGRFGGPGDRSVEGPVDLDGRVIPPEAAQRAAAEAGGVLGTEQLAVQHRHRRVGEDRPRRADLGAVSSEHAHGLPVADEHTSDRRVAADLATAGDEARDECPREVARAALDDGEADVLGERGEQPSVDAAGHGGAREVGVRDVAAEQ